MTILPLRNREWCRNLNEENSPQKSGGLLPDKSKALFEFSDRCCIFSYCLLNKLYKMNVKSQFSAFLYVQIFRNGTVAQMLNKFLTFMGPNGSCPMVHTLGQMNPNHTLTPHFLKTALILSSSQRLEPTGRFSPTGI